MERARRETLAVGIAVSLLAAAAMAVDHLLEDEGAFPADAGTFLLSCALSFALALAVFGWLVPRSSPGRRSPSRRSRCSRSR